MATGKMEQLQIPGLRECVKRILNRTVLGRIVWLLPDRKLSHVSRQAT